jgi:hypothetical protein
MMWVRQTQMRNTRHGARLLTFNVADFSRFTGFESGPRPGYWKDHIVPASVQTQSHDSPPRTRRRVGWVEQSEAGQVSRPRWKIGNFRSRCPGESRDPCFCRLELRKAIPVPYQRLPVRAVGTMDPGFRRGRLSGSVSERFLLSLSQLNPSYRVEGLNHPNASKH